MCALIRIGSIECKNTLLPGKNSKTLQKALKVWPKNSMLRRLRASVDSKISVKKSLGYIYRQRKKNLFSRKFPGFFCPEKNTLEFLEIPHFWARNEHDFFVLGCLWTTRTPNLWHPRTRVFLGWKISLRFGLSMAYSLPLKASIQDFHESQCKSEILITLVLLN